MTGGAAPRRKGARAEVALVRWLRVNGWPDARRYLAGDGRQPGDVDGVPGVCLEVKDQQRHDVAGWLRQTEAEAGPNLPVLVVRPRGVTDPGRWWAVLRVGALAELLTEPTNETGEENMTNPMSVEEYTAEMRRLIAEARRDEAIAEAFALECAEKFGLGDDHPHPEGQ